jgi:hypothetical protein
MVALVRISLRGLPRSLLPVVEAAELELNSVSPPPDTFEEEFPKLITYWEMPSLVTVNSKPDISMGNTIRNLSKEDRHYRVRSLLSRSAIIMTLIMRLPESNPLVNDRRGPVITRLWQNGPHLPVTSGR